MALTDFREYFDPTYQEILQKTLVGRKIANTRFQSELKYGDTVNRFALDLSAVQVRDVVALTDRTLDPVTDSQETLTINFKKGMTFPIFSLEKIQAGPLNPGETAGKNCAMKLGAALDAFILAETVNAWAVFDTGNLTTTTANGTPIALSSTTVPQMVAQTYAKLASNNVEMTDLCWVLDPFHISAISQFPIGKELSGGNTTFKNGYAGSDIYGTMYHMSNNLTGEATLVYTGNHVNAETVTINGIVTTGVTNIGATAGNFLVSASDSTTGITNLAGLLNNPGTTSANQVALSAANQAAIAAMYLTATATSTTVLTIVAKGTRLVLSETQTNATWATQFVHAYFGKKGAIDVVIQEEIDLLITQPPLQRSQYFLLDMVAGIKTFADGANKFLDVKISNTNG